MQDIRIKSVSSKSLWVVPQEYIKEKPRQRINKKIIKKIIFKTETLITQLEKVGFKGMSEVATYIILNDIKDLTKNIMKM
jgi:hypothetical protein